jgi:DNA-binding protein HU-beta
VKINQSGFIEILAARCGITATQSDQIINRFKHLIYESLADGHTVELSGFGQFSVSHREVREGINPRTLERITIHALNTPKFRAGSVFKEAVKLK